MQIRCPTCDTQFQLQVPPAALSRGAHQLRFRCHNCGTMIAMEDPELEAFEKAAHNPRAPAPPPTPSFLEALVPAEEPPGDPESDPDVMLPFEAPDAPAFPPPAPAPARSAPQDRAASQGLLLKQEGKVYRVADIATVQRWVVERRVLREDLISTEGTRWEPVGQHPELELFFATVERLDELELRQNHQGTEKHSHAPPLPDDAPLGNALVDPRQSDPLRASGPSSFGGMPEDPLTTLVPADLPPSPGDIESAFFEGMPAYTEEDPYGDFVPATIAVPPEELTSPFGVDHLATEEAPEDLVEEKSDRGGLIISLHSQPPDDPSSEEELAPARALEPPASVVVDDEAPEAEEDEVPEPDEGSANDPLEGVFPLRGSDKPGPGDDGDLRSMIPGARDSESSTTPAFLVVAVLAAALLLLVWWGSRSPDAPPELPTRVAEATDPAAAEARAKAEARRKAEQEARQLEEARQQEEARLKADAEREAEAQREADAEARRKADAERDAQARLDADADAQRKADAERKAEAQRKADAERKAEAQRKADAERKAAAPAPDPAERGWGAIAQQQWGTAETAFNQAIAADQGNALAHYGLGYLAWKQGRNETAVRSFCQALRYGSGDVDLERDILGILNQLGERC